MGTPDFAIPSLERLHHEGIEIAAVVTAPDKPAGRGQQMQASAVKIRALTMGLPTLQPKALDDAEFIELLGELAADFIIVVAFRILPPAVFRIPKFGTINLHASLLPKYRGAAPINWAIINGERETGVTTFFIDEKIDTGLWLMRYPVPIDADTTAGELHDRLAQVGAEVLLETVAGVAAGELKPKPQEGEFSRAPKLTRELGHIDWSRPAVAVHNLVRGLSPFPGSYSFLHGKLIKILRAKPVDSKRSSAAAGSVLAIDRSGDILVSAGDGPLAVVELQPEGRRPMTASEFLRGHMVSVGDRLE